MPLDHKLPKGWQLLKLGDICEIDRGASPRPINKYITDSSDGVNWVKIGDASESDKYIYKTADKITLEGAAKSRKVSVGDFILSNSMSFGRPYIMGIDGYVHDGWLRIRIETSKIDKDFLYYLLKSNFVLSQFEAAATGGVVRNLNSALVRNTQINLPPLPTQRKIVEILDAVDALRNKRREADEKMKGLIPALFVKMFGDPTTNPMGWEIVKLGDVCEIASGYGFPVRCQGKMDAEIPFYKVSDMNLAGNEMYMLSHNNAVSLEDAQLFGNPQPPNTIILPKIGAAIATNKKRILTKQSLYDNNVMGLISGPKMHYLYLYYWLASFDISNWASESQPPSMRQGTVKGQRLMLPPIDIQGQFAAFASRINEEQERQKIGSNIINTLFESLMHKAFCGELVA